MTYTYKQILLGVRAELLQLNKELDKLKQFTTSNKHIQDYYFNLWPTLDLNPELYLYTEKKPNIISSLKSQLGYLDTKKVSIITKGNSGLYHIDYPGNHQVLLNFADQEKFAKLADEILASEVARKMLINVSIQGLDKIRDAKLTLLFYQLHLKLNKTANFFQMTYFGREDILKYRACRIFNTAITHPNMNAKTPFNSRNTRLYLKY